MVTTCSARITTAGLALALAWASAGCSKDEGSGAKPGASASASAAPAASSAPVASATASAAPSASAAGPIHDCPKGSTGDASFAKPCDAKGNARMMEVKWTGKTDEKGPHFNVVNKSPSTILYGQVVAYFYDKAGKQLEVKDPGAAKGQPNLPCGGNIFSGVMKAGEKAVITFSCIDQKHVPDGTAAIEAEMKMVGFADATEKKNEYYWRNADLAPDTRPKGGVK